ncbi:MAG: helix-turn-helix domain-containing protein [Clostridiales bacterium]|nr:helix-turn-helix domain-containing protein [Clostridiales bacterium]
MSQPLNEVLRLRRRAKGLTQEQLADIIHVSRQTISNWENGRANPDYELLKQLSETLETPLSVLLGVEEAAAANAGRALAGGGAVAGDSASPGDGEAPGDGVLPQAMPPVAPSQAGAPSPGGAHPGAATAPSEGMSSRKRRWFAALLCAVCAFAALAGVLAHWTNRQPPIIPSPYPIEWFEQETARVEGQAYVSMKVLQTPVKRTGLNSDTCYTWKYRLQLCEQGGVGFNITQLQEYYFHENGHHSVVITPAEKLQIGIGTNELRANAVRSLTCQNQSNQCFLGVGYLLEGVDANGNQLSFRCYVPYSDEIAQR